MARTLTVAALLLTFATGAQARDNGQWATDDPAQQAIVHWYQHLMQPDAPDVSCCGEADAYWCDGIHVREDKTYCTITDDRPDAPLGRPHVKIGTEIFIPNHKLKWDEGNPTGHAIVFLSTGGYVWCFVQGTGG